MSCFADKKDARVLVAAMRSPIFERPENTGSFRLLNVGPQKPRTDAKQKAAPKLQTFGLRFIPRECLQQRKPCIFEMRQFVTADPPCNQLAGDRLQPGLGGQRIPMVQLVKPLAPPGEADRAEPRVGARRNHVGEREIEVPKG
jgi:hypothetical protein